VGRWVTGFGIVYLRLSCGHSIREEEWFRHGKHFCYNCPR
jgi:hypothetical protein